MPSRQQKVIQLTTLESRVQEWVCLLLVSTNINSLTQAGTVKILGRRVAG